MGRKALKLCQLAVYSYCLGRFGAWLDEWLEPRPRESPRDLAELGALAWNEGDKETAHKIWSQLDRRIRKAAHHG